MSEPTKAAQPPFFIMFLFFSLFLAWLNILILLILFLFCHSFLQIPSSVFSMVKLYYAYVVFASYMIQLYVPIVILESPVYRKLRLYRLEERSPRIGKHLFLIFQLIFRTLVVLMTGMIILLRHYLAYNILIKVILWTDPRQYKHI